MRQKLLVANWKMNPQTYAEAGKLADDVIYGIGGMSRRVVLCPPFPWVDNFARSHKAVAWGAQDVFWKDSGAFTGEVSPTMLKDAGVSYVIVGHSERRKFVNETDRMVNEKVKAAVSAGLMPILCVGEWNRVSFEEAKQFVEEQLRKNLKGVTSSIIIAYEPVWAVSTNKGATPDTPESAGRMIRFIKEILHTRYQTRDTKVLYGGSVSSKNIEGFLDDSMIDGFLIGGASLIPREIEKMYTMTITK